MLNALLWNLLLTAVLAIVLAGLCRLSSLHRRPALRHWLWLLVLAKLVTPPLVAVPLLPAIPAVAGSEDAVATAIPPSEPTADCEPIGDRQTIGANPAADNAAFAQTDHDLDEGASPEPQAHTQALLLGGLLAISLIGTCVLWTVHGVHAAKLYRWIKRAGRENFFLAESCTDVAASLKVRGDVRSCVVDARTTPLLWGWHRPLVVLPRRLVDELSPLQLRSIVAHELAHFLRHDHWANVFVFIVKGLLWWNPVVWWADRELRAAQELCCDAIAIDRCKANRRSYAVTLLKALDFIQTEPVVPRALAAGMGSRRSILRRFEMIGETQLSYRLTCWTFFALLALMLPLLCIPVHGQSEEPATPAVSDGGGANASADNGDKKPQTAKTDQAKTGDAADAQSIDAKTREIGEAVHKRLTTYSDEETLTLKDGQSGRMKVKKNVTPVAEILITAHFVPNGTKFDLEAFDATGKSIERTKEDSGVIHDAQTQRLGMNVPSSVDGKQILCKIQLTPTRQGDKSAAVEVKVLFTPVPTAKELDAMLKTQGKSGQLRLDFQTINAWIAEYQQRTGHYPNDLSELKKPLPKDVCSPTSKSYHYEAQRSRFILSSCGKDGIYGNEDDEIEVHYSGGSTTGQRHEMYPLEEEKEIRPQGRVAQQSETTVGDRPQGNCSISGKVISAETGKPVDHARMYLHYGVTHGSIFVHTDSDGTFAIENIPKGPFSLQVSLSDGYQDVAYNPDNKPLPFPPFSLKDGEHRSGIVLKAKPAYRVSGKVLDENGKIPQDIGTLTVLGWSKNADGSGYQTIHARVNAADGSYLIDGLGGKPVYVMAINWRRAREGDACPPIYYPSAFSRNDAKQVTFDKEHAVENVNITLKKEGGIVLEGTVLDEGGKPVPEAFIVVNRRDMLFDFVTAYTDEQGHYKIQGLGDGEFTVHVDAIHRGFVRMRTPLNLDKDSKEARRDFTLAKGVTISGKFVDEKGKDWQIAESFGVAHVDVKRSKNNFGTYSLTRFWNKYLPHDVTEERAGGAFALGEGPYEDGYMHFPTQTTFIIPGMAPGKTMLQFLPSKERQKVVQILYDGRDILKSGIQTKPGQDVKDVTIVIGVQ